MKKCKRIMMLMLCVSITASMLSGCGFFDRAGEQLEGLLNFDSREAGSYSDDLIHFEDIEYKRPDMAAFRASIDKAEKALDDGKSYRTVTGLLDDCYAKYYTYYTMYNLADIRTCQDLTDSFYANEYNWCDENYSRAQQYMDELYYACAASGIAQRLERDYFWDGFCEEYLDSSESYYNDDAIELMDRESALLAEYHALNTAPTITVDGEEVDYYTHLYETDDYYAAQMDYYRQYNGEFARIYRELIIVRRELAGLLGYDSYEQMQYLDYFERDYTPEQSAEYIQEIKEYVVPAYQQIMQTDPYGAVSYDYLSERELMRVIRCGAQSMGDDIQSAFEFMYNGGYFDASVSPNKAPMSFQTYLSDYEAPFLFVDAYGDVEDILSVAHEFGHYTDAYVNYDAYETIDLSECFSQAMEYLMLMYLDGYLSDAELENLVRIKMLDTFALYVQQTSFAEFERRVYALADDELTAEKFNAISLEVAEEYGYCDAKNKDYYAMSWIDIPHFFEMPFYVISYPVSNDIAMQIYAFEQQERGAGLEKYLEMLSRDSGSFMDAILSGGLESPFDAGRAADTAQQLYRIFESVSMAA